MLVDAYTPDNLIAGQTQTVADSVTVLIGQVLTRGAVLGKITTGGKFISSLAAAIDGSETPTAILAEDCDASSGDVTNVAVYIKGEFNENVLSFGTGHDATTVKAPLRNVGIYTKSAVGA